MLSPRMCSYASFIGRRQSYTRSAAVVTYSAISGGMPKYRRMSRSDSVAQRRKYHFCAFGLADVFRLNSPKTCSACWVSSPVLNAAYSSSAEVAILASMTSRWYVYRRWLLRIGRWRSLSP
jgi:hypothetical protein